MSSVSDSKLKLKIVDCHTVNPEKVSTENIGNCNKKQQEEKLNSQINSSINNNGTKLKQTFLTNVNNSFIRNNTSSSEISLKRRENFTKFDFHNKNTGDEQKVLKREQELRKQLYSGSNVASGWLRVNHNNKIIYISPSGIGLASLKQIKHYLLTPGTCKCGLPFPLRIELFFDFNTKVSNVPLKKSIDGINFDPNCRHQQKSTPSHQVEFDELHETNQFAQKPTILKKKQKRERLLPSYIKEKSMNKSNESESTKTKKNRVTILTTNNILETNVVQQKNQNKTSIQNNKILNQYGNGHINNMANFTNFKTVEEQSEVISIDAKLPPWRKKASQNEFVTNISNSDNFRNNIHSSNLSASTNVIPIFQINGQIINVDNQNQHFCNHSQQIQIIEHKNVDETRALTRCKPATFKEDPTAYLNQQTALLHNTITTLHSPERPSTSNSLSAHDDPKEIQKFAKIMKAPNAQSTIDGHVMTHGISNEIQLQNCDIKQQIQEKVGRQQQQYINLKSNQKGRPPKNSKSFENVSQDSPVSSTSCTTKVTKANTPEITSSSSEGTIENFMQPPNNYDSPEIVNLSRNFKSSTQGIIRTSMAHVMSRKIPNLVTASSLRKSPSCITSKKSQSQILPQANNNNSSNSSNISVTQNSASQQVMMSSNGQQYLVMPSTSIQIQPQNFIVNNATVAQLQNLNSNLTQRTLQNSGQSGNIIIQANNGHLFSTNTTNFIVNGSQPLFLQNGQIIQHNTSNPIGHPKSNILVAEGSSTKTFITGNNQHILGQQAVFLQNNTASAPNIINDSAFFQTVKHQQQQQPKLIFNSEKKKGRKRKIPVTETSISIPQHTSMQATQQPHMIQIPESITQSFQISTPSIIARAANEQIILQNGQTIIQQPINFLSGQQIMSSSVNTPLMTISADGNSYVQIQNPSLNNIITTPQSMLRTALPQQQLQQKTIISNNGQHYILQGNVSQIPFNSMGFVVQSHQNHDQQQNQHIVFQSATQGQHIVPIQQQILPENAAQTASQGRMLTSQQSHFVNQNDIKFHKMMTHNHRTSQNQKPLFTQIIGNSQATTSFEASTKNSSMTSINQHIIEDQYLKEEDHNEDIIDEEDFCDEETDAEELELSFENDEKPDMIEELHHGTSQQILHSSSMIDGQYNIMNMDDITIEMDEINDLNEYLNAIDEEDNKISQIGLSSIQNVKNSTPDTTTHSPRSVVDNVRNVHYIISNRNENDNGSNESNNMVSSSDLSPDCGSSQALFKLPLEPRSSHLKSPISYNMISATSSNLFDHNSQSPLMHPDSYGAEN